MEHIQRDIDSELGDLFPGWDVVRAPRPAPDSGHSSVGVSLRDADAKVNLMVEFTTIASRARLRDAASALVQRQAGEQGAIYVLASAFISPTNQQILREAGAPFFDFAGNAWIVHDRFHIDRRGFANPSKESRPARNPFSDKASLVLRLLMSTQEHMGIRQIAEEAELTAGYVSKVAQELERRGYLHRKHEGIVLRHPTDLLQEWVYSYRKRRPTAGVNFFVPVQHADELIGRLSQARVAGSDDYVLTLHAGASLVDRYADFDTVDLYVRNLELADAIAAELGGRAVERGGNLSMRVPYYRVSAFFGKRRLGGLWVASDVQLYLDLYDYPVRGREQAEHLYNRHLRPLLEADDTL